MRWLGALAWALLIAVVGAWIYARSGPGEERARSFFAYHLAGDRVEARRDGTLSADPWAGGAGEIRFAVPEDRPPLQVLSWVGRLPSWALLEPRTFVRYALDIGFEDASGAEIASSRVWFWSRAAAGLDASRRLVSTLWLDEREPMSDGRAVHLSTPERAATLRVRAVQAARRGAGASATVDPWEGPIYLAALEEVPQGPLQRLSLLDGSASRASDALAAEIAPWPWAEIPLPWRERASSLHWKRLTPLSAPATVTVYTRGESLPYPRVPLSGTVLVPGAALAWNVRGPITVQARWVSIEGDPDLPAPVSIRLVGEDGVERLRQDMDGNEERVEIPAGVSTLSLALSPLAPRPILALAVLPTPPEVGADPGDARPGDILPGPWGRGGRELAEQGFIQAADVRSFDVWRAGPDLPLSWSAPLARMVFHLRASLPIDRLTGLTPPPPSGITAVLRALDPDGRELYREEIALPGPSPFERALRDEVDLPSDPAEVYPGETPPAFAVGEVVSLRAYVPGASRYEITGTGPLDVVGNVEINDSLAPFEDPAYALTERSLLPDGRRAVIARYAPLYREPTRVVPPLDAQILAAAGRLSRVDAQIRLVPRGELIEEGAGVHTTGTLPLPDPYELLALPVAPGSATIPDRVPLHGAGGAVYVPGSGRVSVEYQIPAASAGAPISVWISGEGQDGRGPARQLTLPTSAGSFLLSALLPGSRQIRVEGAGRFWAVASGAPGWFARRVWYRAAGQITRVEVPAGAHAASILVHRWGGCGGWIAWERGEQAGMAPIGAPVGRAELITRSSGGMDVCAPVFLGGLVGPGALEFSLEGLDLAGGAGAWISVRTDWSDPSGPEPLHQRIGEGVGIGGAR